jgi:hypothetical protein
MKGTPVKMTKEQIQEMIATTAKRYRGEPPQWRYGYLCALHQIGEDDGKDDCNHYDTEGSLEAFFKLIGKDYKQVYA